MGPAYFKAVKAPLSHIRLLAVGSVNAENLVSYLKAGASGAGVAGCLFTKEQVLSGEWDVIAGNAKALTAIVREAGK